MLAAATLAAACARPAEPVGKKAAPPVTSSKDAAPPVTAPAPAADAEDAGTALSARKWKYAAFFNRLKRAVFQNWSPTPAMLDGPAPPGPDGVATVVLIVLNPAGDVVDVRIEESSGHPALDAEGQRAVRAAGPFRNPPPGLVHANTGTIAFPFRLHYQR